jgi:hypothetical protein
MLDYIHLEGLRSTYTSLNDEKVRFNISGWDNLM